MCACYVFIWDCSGLSSNPGASPPSLSSGGPFDLMSCRVVAAGTREMAMLIAQALQTINYGRDDEK